MYTQLNDTGAAEHFVQEGHNFDQHLELFVLESGNWRSAAERKKRESYYIIMSIYMQALNVGASRSQ